MTDPTENERPGATPDATTWSRNRALEEILNTKTTEPGLMSPLVRVALQSVTGCVIGGITRKRDDEDSTQRATRIMAAMAGTPELSDPLEAVQRYLEVRRAAVGRGLDAARDAALAQLPPVEREWIAAHPEELEDLNRRLLAEWTSLAEYLGADLVRLGQAERKLPGDASWINRRAFARRVDHLARLDTDDGRRIRAAAARMWLSTMENARRLRDTYGPPWTEEDEQSSAHAKAALATGDLPSFEDVEFLRWDPSIDLAALVEVEAAAIWPTIREAWRAENAPDLAVRWVAFLGKDKPDEDVPADAEPRLALAVKERLRALPFPEGRKPSLGFGLLTLFVPRPPEVSDTGELSGMYYRDELAARYLETLGDEGTQLRAKAVEYAELLRGAARKKWTAWLDQRPLPGASAPDPAEAWESPLRLPRMLASVLWRGEVREALARGVSRLPGLIVAVASGLARVSSTQLSLGIDELGGAAVVRPSPRGKSAAPLVVAEPLIPFAAMEVIDAVRSLSAIGSRYGAPTVEAVVERSQLGQSGPGVQVSSDGGTVAYDTWKRLALDALGEINHSDDVTNVRAAARALARLPIRWPDGRESSAIWVLDDDDLRPGAPTRGPVFRLSHRLQHGETFRAREPKKLGGLERENTRIVPLLRKQHRNIKPVPGSNRKSYTAQGTFRRLLWLHFAKHGSRFLVPGGGVPISEADLRALADEAGLSADLRTKILPHLVRLGVIRETSPGHFAPTDADTIKFIADGWRKGQAAAERAKIRAARQEGQTPRRGRPPKKAAP